MQLKQKLVFVLFNKDFEYFFFQFIIWLSVISPVENMVWHQSPAFFSYSNVASVFCWGAQYSRFWFSIYESTTKNNSAESFLHSIPRHMLNFQWDFAVRYKAMFDTSGVEQFQPDSPPKSDISEPSAENIHSISPLEHNQPPASYHSFVPYMLRLHAIADQKPTSNWPVTHIHLCARNSNSPDLSALKLPLCLFKSTAEHKPVWGTQWRVLLQLSSTHRL